MNYLTLPLAALLLLTAPNTSFAADPAWWAARGVTTSAPSSNFSPATIGQAKHMVSEALNALNVVAPAIATQVRSDLAGFPPGYADRVIDLTVPGTKSAVWIDQQKAPLLIGQLKAISAPFYTRLNSVNSAWLTAQRTSNSTNHPNSIFPWTAQTTDDQNKAIATIGQLKAVFSLGFETFFAIDADADGILDAHESNLIYRTPLGGWGYFDPQLADTDGNGIDDGDEDYDRDGLTTLQEINLGTDPNKADTDADGVKDGDEISIGSNPFVADAWFDAQGVPRDSDGDGLSDIFEIAYGTNPLDPDTNSNGMPDGPELDAGGDPRTPGDPPGDPPPIVIVEIPNDPEITYPPPLPPGQHQILVESVQVSFPKHGHPTFKPLNPAKRYLKMDSSQSFRGGCPESGPLYITGDRSNIIDPVTGIETEEGESYVSTGDTPESPMRAKGSYNISGYDDPPNTQPDCQGEVHYTSVLSEENTTPDMIANGKSEMDDFEGGEALQPGTPFAYRNVHENELNFEYRKTQFKFKWQPGVVAAQRHALTYLLLFTPEDDPDTTEVEKPEIVDTIAWDGQSDESSMFEIDPDEKRAGKDGTYSLLPVEVNYVDRDVMTNQWAQKKPFASSTDAALFAGPHSGDMVEWRLPDGLFQDQTISWNAKHIASGEITYGPSSVGVNFWRIADDGGNDPEQDEWLKWKPGEYMISCELDGKTVEIQRVRVGYRSDHILVIGQIVPTFSHDLDKPIGGSAGLWASAVADDITSSILPAAVPLDFHDNVALGMGATFLLLPERGAEAWAACWAGELGYPPGLIPSWWPSAWILPPFAPPAVPTASTGPAFTSYGGKFRPMGTMTARHHYWATQHMLNTNPDTPTVPAAIFVKRSDAPSDETSFAHIFTNKQYRVLHEFQAKFLLTNQGKIEQSTFVPIHNRAAKGTTKLKVLEVNAGDWGTVHAPIGVGLPPISMPLPPFDIKPFPDEDSETNLHNERISHAAAGDEVSSFATARIGEKGRRVSYRQFGKDAPWIFSEIIFHVESDWKVNLKGRTSTTVQWDLLINPDESQSVIVSRSPHAPASTPGISIFNNLNLYARSELDQFILLKDGLLNMEGHLQSFVESGSGAWPEAVIPPTVK